MRGQIAPGILPGLLRDVYVSRHTGMLRFAHGQDYCSIRFVKGHIVFGAASEKRLHMGEVMVKEGLLSRDHLEQATMLVLSERLRLGEALLSLGVVDHELLEEFLGFHVREILAEVFSWPDGEFSFEEQDPETEMDHDFPLKMSTGEVIMDAARQVQEREHVLFALGNMERVLLASTEPLVRFQRVTLTPVDGFVLSRVDGTLSAKEIIEITPLEATAVEASLFALLCTGILEYASEKPKAPERETAQFLRQEIFEVYHGLGGQNHYEVLGLESGATTAQIKAAFLRLAKRYHPDAHHDPALKDFRDKLEAIFFRVAEAHRVLSDAPSREAYSSRLGGSPAQPTQPPGPAAPSAKPKPEANTQATTEAAPIVTQAVNAIQAEELFQTANDHFTEGRYWEAVALLSETVKGAEGRLRQRARVLLARAYLKHPDTESQAEKQLLAVLRDDPENLDAHFYLGTIYKHMGRKARAAGMFRRVLEQRPNHREAIAELETLEGASKEAPPEEKGGILGKLFGKG